MPELPETLDEAIAQAKSATAAAIAGGRARLQVELLFRSSNLPVAAQFIELFKDLDRTCECSSPMQVQRP